MSKDHSNTPRVRYKSLSFMDYPNYRVGDDGSVWSCANNRWGMGKWRKLRPTKCPQGSNRDRMVINLWRDNKGKTYLVHRLVLLAFLGEPETKDMMCCHNDGDPTNNQLSNLRWGTMKDNQQDRIKHGTANRGNRHPLAKLRAEDIPLIRKRILQGHCLRSIARDYAISDTVIRSIKSRKTWWHI